MKCPNCKDGAVQVDESHNEICEECDGYGYIALVKNDNDKKV